MTINCNGRLIDLNEPKIMGILNTTPNSFYDGGSSQSMDLILDKVEKYLSEGADILENLAQKKFRNKKKLTELLQLLKQLVQNILKQLFLLILLEEMLRARL